MARLGRHPPIARRMGTAQFTACNIIACHEIAKGRMSAATSFYSTFQQLTLSLGLCLGARSLHASMVLRGVDRPGFDQATRKQPR